MVLQPSPSRDQLSHDFQNKWECYFPWVKSLETDGYVVSGNPSGAKILLPVLSVLRTANDLVVVVYS